ncbi:LamG domain-containing protein [Lentzea sp. NPDC034063]|uniref:LamG domain-containing protein n=1 Tax=unclassified Lentzea TaxID=2643253 RepID=UPI0033DFCB66
MLHRRRAASQSCLRTSRNVSAALLSLALAATVVAVVADTPQTAAPQPVTEAPDTATALNAARAQGIEVEAVNMRTETREVFAQPSGHLKAAVSALPQRVQRDGKWVSIDPELTPTDKGLETKATSVGMTFSRGGTEPLVRLGKGGKEFTLTWPGVLPAPAVDGPVATYREVFEGVDLKMTAKNGGYEQLLVVKDKTAAEHVTAVKLGMQTTGLTVRPGAEGAFDLVDAAGEVVFAVPQSLMWDSKQRAETEAPRTDQVPIGVEFAADSLTLLPDQKLLTDPATVYPVYVDPAPAEKSNVGWTTVYDDGSNPMREKPHWNGADSQAETYSWVRVDPTARSGRAYLTSPKLVTRSYFQFDTSFLNGKSVSSARMDATVVHSPTCNAWHQHDLHVANGDIGPGTNWNNQPGDIGVLTSASVPSVNGNCSEHKAFSFSKDTFHHWLDTTGNSTYWIGSSDDENAWRKFDPSKSKLVVYYNGRADTPRDPATVENLQACGHCGGMPWYGGSTITLKANVSDSDGDQVKATWDVYDENPDVANTQNKRVFWSNAWLPSWSNTSQDVSLTGVADGRLVTWFVAADDGAWRSDYVLGPKQFRIDRTNPVNKPDVSSVGYPEDNRWHGGTTVPGKFTFTAKDADTDRFAYGWDDDTTPLSAQADALGGSTTVTLTMPGDGPRDLFVRSVDRAGNAGPARVYHIYVRAGTGAIAQYAMDGNVNDTAYLGDRHGTTHGETGFTTGAVGSALALDGMGGHATAPNAVRTDSSFSVSAWVRLDGGLDQYWRAVVSQDGNSVCAFCLQYQADNRRWVFVMPQQDSANPTTWGVVKSLEEPTPGAWTHLTGVFDADTKDVKLYVNGVLQGTGKATTPWHAAGELRIGQAKAQGTFHHSMFGAIDEVRVYDRALTDAEVTGEVRRDNVQVGHWRFEDAPGTTARNAVTNGANAALSGGVSFFEQRPQPKNNAVRFDGTGQARTTGAVVRTDKSFTVSASVTLSDTTGPMTVLSQDGPSSSGFVLQQKDGRWLFGMTEGNGSTAWNVLAQSAPGSAVKNVPTHLAAVFDTGTKKATLYLDGGEAAVSAVATKPFWDAGGPFVMGTDQQGAFLKGDLDDVRVHSRALAADEIRDIVKLDADPVRQWRLDGDAVDASGNNGTLTLGDPVDWVSGQNENSDPKDLGVRLTGVPGSSLRAGHAVDTSRNFSVSAWARLDSVVSDRYPAVLSQDGNTVSAFQLQATPDGHWSFAMFGKDETNGGGRQTRAIGAVAQQGVWTHLVGTYDAARDRMTLYVNGIEAASATHPDAWDRPDGQFRIGRAQWNGADVDLFPGAIDDVEVHNRALFADEIRAKSGRDLNLLHKWQFDEGVGATAGDAVGGKAGTLTNATYAPGRLGNAVSFNGAGEVSTGAVPRTDQSFTVSAWVYLPEECSAAKCKKVAVSQDANQNSKFRLGYLQDRNNPANWIFEMPEDDLGNTVITKAAVSVERSDFKKWVHLVGVYDRAAKQLLLYVNGNRMGEGALNNAWTASGGVQIGRSKLAGVPAEAERWTGSVDDVRMYTGATNLDGVFKLYKSYPAQDQPAATLPVADAGHWKLDEKTGTTAADSSGRGNALTLSSGSTWGGGRNAGSAWFNGSSGAGETAGPVIDTSRSYTVSAWAYPETGITGNRSIVAQDGAQDSAFVLSYNGDSGRWAVVQPHADVNGGTATVLVSSETAKIGRWTHLAVAYDAEAKQLRLYVNGVQSAVKVGAVGWNATGPFTVGRSKWDGVKGSWWNKGVDDVRVYTKALTQGEINLVHNDVMLNDAGLWKFDASNGDDTTWRANTLTTTGGVTFGRGVFGTSMKFDGTGSATAKAYGVNPRDSFTVQAWARLERDDRTSTVLGQDGTEVSGFVLQYRQESKRWAFSAPVQDSTEAPLAKALSAEPAVLGRWTHLAGVYDHGAGLLKLYVDGKLVGTTSGRMWLADGPMSVGRSKSDGKDAEQFVGLVDEVRVELGMAPDATLLERASRPLSPAGQLGRFISTAGVGEHYTGLTGVAPLPNYRYEGVMGQPPSLTEANTQPLYSCKSGNDHFSSTAADCEGATLIGETGAVYSVKPVNIPAVELNLCVVNADRFTATAEDCEGQTKVKRLGWLRGYAPLSRYISTSFPWDHWSTTHGVAPGYRHEGVLGVLGLASAPGTAVLWLCREGADTFSSRDSACGGKERLGGIGYVWTSPPEGVESKPLMRCRAGATGNRFDSVSSTCEGQLVEEQLGHVLVTTPTTVATF